jgi:hypothetical protein
MTDTTNPSGPGDGTTAAAEPTTAEAGTIGSAQLSGAPAEAAAPEAASGDFRQHYTLLFCSLAMFLAAVAMPIEGGFEGRAQPLDLYAKDSIAGAFLTVFAGYGVLAGWMNIHGRKMIVWPVFFAAADAIYVVVTRALAMVRLVQDPSTLDFRGWIHLFGGGMYVLAVCSLLVIWTLLTAVMDGAKKDAARKEAAKAARTKR